MDSRRKQTFNSVYSGRGCYYGLDVRSEFSEFFQNKDLSGQTAIDLGCGEGRYAIYLAKKGCCVLSVDRSPTGIEKLERMAVAENLPITTQTTDIAEFEFIPASTDIIAAATILDHLEGDLRRRTINGIKSALKPGGIFYANVFTVSDPGYKLKKRGGGDQAFWDVSDTAAGIAHYFAKEELKAVFKDFSVITYYETVEPDHSHGRPHFHGWACLLAQKPGA